MQPILQPIQRHLSDDPNVPDVQFKIFKTKDSIKPQINETNYKADITRGRLNLFGMDEDFNYDDKDEEMDDEEPKEELKKL